MYQNNWESLNSRPVPGWFEDAKFGIFIHWGLYSVPAYAPIGNYAEWYGYNMHNVGSETHDFHLANYGEGFKYADFVKDFKAELFDAQDWVSLFEKAGAKYLNIVSKHHDGFCLYKSDYAWNWNSVDVGPHRDFCAELKAACDKSDVKFGAYHSVYEWFNPLYLKNPEEYALKHLIPMLKEFVEKYQPHTLFTDGEWEHESSVWHSTDFLTWLYNESSVKDYIVPNDRWGKETRGRLGGNFTSEYGLIEANRSVEELVGKRVFEECRGIGASFGFNRMEDVNNYMSAQDLIELFVDLICAGGNLLLNVGPAADGTIPVIMRERLLQIGEWLDVNGQAVYAGRAYKKSSTQDVSYTQKDGNVYAFVKYFPFGQLLLKDIEYSENIKASLLGATCKIDCKNEDGKLKLLFPALNPDLIEAKYVYVLKLEGLI
ncbi:MAG: alpha-L-fucosidase [Clostridiales bacterium]|nr:alpha-L-fucosidase [Clostridiales bacterium]